jgi:hypothetical protein
MIRVKFLKSHPGYAYFAGDMGIVSPEAAEKMLAGGYILPLPEESNEPIVNEIKGDLNTLPPDLPGRDKIFEAGYLTVESVKDAGDKLLDIPGISNAMLKKISKYLESFVFSKE